MSKATTEAVSADKLPSAIQPLPEKYRRNLERAATLLKEGGCREIYLFGSLAQGRHHAGSDIDLAVRGCPKGQFFHLLGRLLMTLDYPVDLVDLDGNDPFAQFLIENEELHKIS